MGAKRHGSKAAANGQQKEEMSMDNLKGEMETDCHTISMDEICSRFSTNETTGLTVEQAKEYLIRDGPNELTPPKKVPEIIKFLKQLSGGFSILLWIGGLLCVIAYVISFSQYDVWQDAPKDNLYLGCVLVAVVLLTGTFSYFQEHQSAKIMDSFRNMIPQSTTVIRGGQKIQIKVAEVVVGDLVEVRGGDKLPADIRVISASAFKVDNSALTGESEAQSRSPECTNENPLETKNLAFFSTNAVEGVCRGFVIQTGDRTLVGRIAKLASGLGQEKTPLRLEIERFVNIVTGLALFYGIAFFIISMSLGYYWLTAILFLIGLVVANVPEGLLAQMTVGLSLTAKRLAEKQCLVKNLEAVETLGSTSTICSDKTGTLTQNRMTVTHMWFNSQIVTANLPDVPIQEVNYHELPGWKDYYRVAALCNRAEFREGENDKPIMQRLTMGDASESAILKFTEFEQANVAGYRQSLRKVAEIPFNSTNKFQLSIHEISDAQYSHVIVLKGAPERVYDKCGRILVAEEEPALNNDWTLKFNDAYIQLGGLGERVIGLADCYLRADKFPRGFSFDVENPNFPLSNFRFVGLISMIDPPRPAVPDAVAKCRAAGIRVIMVTGDHPITAKAIAKSVGIVLKDSKTLKDIAAEEDKPVEMIDPRRAKAAVVPGSELRDMTPNELDQLLLNHEDIVFARTSPQQKLVIVEANQRIGAIVAVTGDGVNDSPAIKKAHIGIAMGIAGTDVTKEAANMVLLDDNFATIVLGIEEGRKIFDNLKKSIGYILTSNIPELIPLLLYIVARFPLGLTTITILCIDLGTDIYPGIAYAYEQPENDIMKRKPRKLTDHMVTMRLINLAYGVLGIVETFAGFFLYFVVLGENGWLMKDLVMVVSRGWENACINDLPDSYGQEWTFHQRMDLQLQCSAAFLCAIVLSQWSNAIVYKTRTVSMFNHGMRNMYLTSAIFFETALVLFLIYYPPMNSTFGLRPLHYLWWLVPLPFIVFHLFIEEMRKLYMRKNIKNPRNLLAYLTLY